MDTNKTNPSQLAQDSTDTNNDATQEGQTDSRQTEAWHGVDLSSLYPTPKSASMPNQRSGSNSAYLPPRSPLIDETRPTVNGESRAVRAGIIFVAVGIMLAPLLGTIAIMPWVFFGLQNTPAQGFAGLIVSAYVMNPIALLATVLCLVIGIGILRRKEIARLALVLILILSLGSQLYSLVSYVLPANGRALAQQQVFPDDMSGGASQAQAQAQAQTQEAERRQADESLDRQRLEQVPASTKQSDAPRRPAVSPAIVALQVVSIAVQAAMIVFLIRPSVKKQFG